jgi:hypothetical protein
MHKWLRYFQHNKIHRIDIPWQSEIAPEPHLREALISSLQRFQVGETGEGRHLMKGARRTGDADYIEAMQLFINEEHEHARLLAEILKRLHAPLLDKHWSDGAFVVLRHLAGLRTELLMLLVAEMIAKCYYRTLRDGTSDAVLRTIFMQIIHDEDGHVAFHCSFLRRSFRRWPKPARKALQLLWRAVYRAACIVVMFDHRAVLAACGLSAGTFWRDTGSIFDQDSASALGLPVTERRLAYTPSHEHKR